ncbi:MAG: hypothetical protein L3J32_08355 [Rhizobiaceae bacterium]|nr:hypothetical protein [Rhizobiaceae bacterium]
MLARLYGDLLSLRKENSPLIFDTDLSGNGIINYMADKAQAIDLSRVTDQVSLFDTMLDLTSNASKSGSEGPDFVIDVSANELNRFFRIFSDIGFERGAFEVQLDIKVCHIISWTLKSLQNAARVRDLLNTSQFIAVRNMAIEAVAFTPSPEEEASVPDIEIDLFLNALTTNASKIVNEKTFSFATFIEGGYQHLNYEMKAEILGFLEDVHSQLNELTR